MLLWKTLAEVGKSSKVDTKNKYSERISVVLTVRADGLKLPLLFIIKGQPGGLFEKKELPTYDPTHKTLWTVDMVQVLLELRLRAYGPPFQGSKSDQQLSILWQKIAMRLSIVTGVVVSQTSAKAKYHSLKQEYSRIRVAEQATGNNADEGVEYPA
ncbi:hypothetical protein DYB28_000477 [Aphanomyces astaci]|uniref:DDE-1 domain-containing protein n=1 Tax=Aphanomyces astaci TaxID=112090 RepID=A0A9X8H7N5_APHAT|nr:hypothetical protein DYB28_000477 [Aphanomyces astaci]